MRGKLLLHFFHSKVKNQTDSCQAAGFNEKAMTAVRRRLGLVQFWLETTTNLIWTEDENDECGIFSTVKTRDQV